jgi:hypothetical protein
MATGVLGTSTVAFAWLTSRTNNAHQRALARTSADLAVQAKVREEGREDRLLLRNDRMKVIATYLRHSDIIWDWCMSQHAPHEGGRDRSDIRPALAEARSSLRELRLLVDSDEALAACQMFSDSLIRFWMVARAAKPATDLMVESRGDVMSCREDAMDELRRLVAVPADQMRTTTSD